MAIFVTFAYKSTQKLKYGCLQHQTAVCARSSREELKLSAKPARYKVASYSSPHVCVAIPRFVLPHS